MFYLEFFQQVINFFCFWYVVNIWLDQFLLFKISRFVQVAQQVFYIEDVGDVVEIIFIDWDMRVICFFNNFQEFFIVYLEIDSYNIYLGMYNLFDGYIIKFDNIFQDINIFFCFFFLVYCQFDGFIDFGLVGVVVIVGVGKVFFYDIGRLDQDIVDWME